ncbi:hypothetical protein BHM03_00013090 [Ensete ventricosum]|nr:hypothetical protein BHM03_00013090 [Ensete ventricosum]
MVPQRWVFRVCTLNLASDGSLGHQHMGAVYHQERTSSASTSESHGGGDLIIQRYDRSDWRVGLLQCSHSLKGAWQVRGQGRRGSATQEQSVSQKGGGLRGVPQYRRGGSTDREERDVDAKQQIVGPWAWQHHGTAEARLLWNHRSLALMEGERWS